MSTKKQLVSRSPDRAWGATVFVGTRVPVEILFQYLEAGDTIDEFLREFPSVSRELAVGVLEEAREKTIEGGEVELGAIERKMWRAAARAKAGDATAELLADRRHEAERDSRS